MTTPSTLYLVPSQKPKQAQNPQTKPEPKAPKPEKSQGSPVTFYQAPPIGSSPLKTLISATLITAAMFLILPFTQYIGQFKDNIFAYQDNTIELAPPPPLPEMEKMKEESKEEEIEPELEMEQPEPITLSELQASLAVGTGTGFGSGKSFEEMFFNVQDIGDIIFEIKDLDQIPRLISADRPMYPHQLKTEGIEGQVTLLVMINPQGRVSILGVKSTTNREFEKSAIKAARSARYTPPIRNGEKVSVKFYLPFNFTITD